MLSTSDVMKPDHRDKVVKSPRRGQGELAASGLSDWLSHQSVVWQGRSVGGALQYEAEELSFTPEAIKSVDELVQVALQVPPYSWDEAAGCQTRW